MEQRLSAENEALWEPAFDVARRYRAFESYGSERKACQALRRRCPGFGPDEYSEMFRQAVYLYDQALDVVETHKGPLLAYYGNPANWKNTVLPEELQLLWQDLYGCLSERCPGLPLSVCRQAANWVFYWHHWR